MDWHRKYRDDDNGVAAIEGAFVFPFLAFLGFGIVDTSLLMMQYHRLSTGITSASNYLSKAPNPQSLESHAKQLAISGNFQSGSKSFISDLQPNDVSIAYRSIANPETNGVREYRGGDVVNVVELTSSVTYNGIGLLKTLTGGTLKLSVHHETRLIGLKT